MFLSEKKVTKLEQKWEKDKDLIERVNQIKIEKSQLKQNFFEKIGTKPLITYLFLNCTLIEIFTMIILLWSLNISAATGLSADMTPLTALISTVVGEVIAFGIYAYKSAKENTKGGTTYLRMEHEFENDSALKDTVIKQEEGDDIGNG